MPVYCPEAITFLLAMIWATTNSEVVAQQTNLSVNYPNALFQFFFYVYNNLPDYMAVFMSTYILNATVASLFPIGTGQQQQNSEPNAPILLSKNRLQPFVMVGVAGKEPLTFHAQCLLLGRPPGGQTVAGHPWPRPRLYRPSDYADQEATDGQHQVRHVSAGHQGTETARG